MYSLRAHLEAMAIHLALPKMSDGDLDTLDDLIDSMIEAGNDDDRERLTELDTRFHEFILERSEHHLLLRTWQSISPLNWTMMTVIRLKDRNLVELAERHRPIVEALRQKDVEQAERAIREHVMVLGHRVVRDLEARSADTGDGEE
jgi:DNA-binding GntR family transcriptional regulator